MKTYITAAGPQIAGEFVAVVGVCLILFVPVVRQGEWVWGLIFLVFAVLVPLVQSIRRVNLIRLHDDGTIEFRRLLGTTRLHVNDITGLTGIRKDTDYGPVEWSMRIWHRGNWLSVPFFDEAWNFVDEVRAMNPYVPVTGEWPMIHPDIRAVPEVRGPSSRVQVRRTGDDGPQDTSGG